MNYLLSHNRRRSPVPASLIAALAAAGMLAFFAIEWLTPQALSGAASRVAAPLWRIRAAAFGSDRAALADELARVRAENAFLRAFAAAQVPPALENEVGTLIVPVLARPRWSAYDTLVVGAGYGDGVHVGARVSASGFALGEVVEVRGDSSLVSLYSTAGKTVVAQIAGTAPIELVGVGGGAFEALAAVGLPVAAGDGAFVPSLASSLFAVVDATVGAGEGVQKIHLRLPVNIFELRMVTVGL